MQEDKQYTDRTNVLHKEDIDMEQSTVIQGPHVRKLVTYDLMRHKPTDEDTGQEAHNWEEQLSGHKVEQVEDSHTTNQEMFADTQRQRANNTHKDTSSRYHHRSPFAGGAQFLLQESRAHLVE